MSISTIYILINEIISKIEGASYPKTISVPIRVTKSTAVDTGAIVDSDVGDSAPTVDVSAQAETSTAVDTGAIVDSDVEDTAPTVDVSAQAEEMSNMDGCVLGRVPDRVVLENSAVLLQDMVEADGLFEKSEICCSPSSAGQLLRNEDNATDGIELSLQKLQVLQDNQEAIITKETIKLKNCFNETNSNGNMNSSMKENSSVSVECRCENGEDSEQIIYFYDNNEFIDVNPVCNRVMVEAIKQRSKSPKRKKKLKSSTKRAYEATSHLGTSSGQAGSPANRTNSPSKLANSPLRSANSSLRQIGSPANRASSPSKCVGTPNNNANRTPPVRSPPTRSGSIGGFRNSSPKKGIQLTVEQREANWIGNFCAASTDKKASPKRLKKQVGSMSGSLLTINQPNSALKRPQSPYLEVREPPPIIWGGLRREELASSTRNRGRSRGRSRSPSPTASIFHHVGDNSRDADFMVIGAPGSLDYDATLQPAACSSVANTPSPKKKSLRPLNGSGKHKPLNTVATSSPSFNLLSGHPSSPMHGDFPGPSDMVVPGMHSSGGCSDHHDHRDHSSRGSARDHRSRSSHSSPDAHDPGAHSPSLVDPLQHELFVQDPNNAIHMNHRGHISEKQHQWELKHHVHYHHLDQSEMEQKLPDIVFPAAKTTHTKGVYLALFPSKSSASRSRSRSRSRSPSQSRAQSRSGSPVVSKSRSESPGLLQWHPDNTTSSEDHSNMQALDSLPPTVALTAESLARHHDATSKGCSRAGSRRNSKTADGSHTKLNTSHDNCVSPCGSTITSHTLSSTNTGLTHPEYEDKRHRKKMEKLLQDEMVEHFLHDACYDDGQLAILDADSLEDVAARMHAHKEANENVHLNHVKIANTYDELLEEAVAVIGSADTIADASTVRRANNSGALLDPDQLEMYMETTAKMAIYRGRKLISGCAKFRERPITNIEKKLYKSPYAQPRDQTYDQRMDTLKSSQILKSDLVQKGTNATSTQAHRMRMGL